MLICILGSWTLEKVVEHYKDALGFAVTSDERDALVAFLEAL